MSMILLPHEADQQRVQSALPGYMFALAFNSLADSGYTVRADLIELANNCSGVAIAEAPANRQAMLAGRVQKDGYDVLKHAGTDNVPKLCRYLAGRSS